MKNFPNIQQGIDSKTCGPNCLLNIYEYFGIQKQLSEILDDLRITSKDPTYISQLARHLLSNKLTTEFITSNPNSVVASWANEPKEKIIGKLIEWITHNSKDLWLMENLHILFYLQEGGDIKIVDLSTNILDDYLDQGYTLLSCLDESWLWEKRQIEDKQEYDDIHGKGRGHFVVIYDKHEDKYSISDPYPTKISGRDGLYEINKQKLLVSTLVWDRAVIAIKK